MRSIYAVIVFLFVTAFVSIAFKQNPQWESAFVQMNKNGSLRYAADEKGNTIPDFSNIGYYGGGKLIPVIDIVKTVSAADGKDAQKIIQDAIDEVAKLPVNKDGFRGAILLRKGTYHIPGTIRIEASGIVLRGEGNATKLIATGTTQRAFIKVGGKGKLEKTPNSSATITDGYVAAGAVSFTVSDATNYQAGDRIIVNRPSTDQWVKDLKMDQIEARDGLKQWTTGEYNFQFERVITKIEGNKISIDNPIVMPMETRYGIPQVYKYTFDGRISNAAVEMLYCESEFSSDTAENHGWDAISFNKIENGWISNITSQYFGYSCVNLGNDSKNITVTNCNCLDAKSQITGGRRYSFNNDGQLNLFVNCHATEGRHDFVTGAQTRGPNVFYNCSAEKTHADIGPHHRWAMGTLYDNIVTDGEINIQDRGNWGTGHGWSGVTQVLWNCTAKAATVQDPYVSGRNYCIGLQGAKGKGRLSGRPDGTWEGQHKNGLHPASLFLAQLAAAGKMKYFKF